MYNCKHNDELLSGITVVFPKWSRTFIEFSDFSEFREFDKSLKHELGSIKFKDSVSRMCLAGTVVVSYIRGGRFEPI